MTGNLDEKEQKLKEKLESLKALEKEILEKEKSIKNKEKTKKQMLLRLSPSLWDELAAWAEDEFRSINGQVEYLLWECVKNRKKK
ncbi:hypothetical protein SAMN02745248_01837 [Hathewaya proteolytica DSM 3090]|uniref:Arc-like DNA binding domain-containing protein n=1 Tax=Hathewaya proteolytica DSM 3090 TaxID=1121331 RepID=A0A1M6PWJ2_9CLOT|nr:hypothetical protein SAMN02745248_01837 [Hathewaya proteolytica DSM 3090]